MNKFFNGFVLMSLVVLLSGCSYLRNRNAGVFGKTSKEQASQNDRIVSLEQSEAKNSNERLSHIGAWSEGTEYTLNKVEEPSKEVIVAKDINERIQALANKPDFNEVKEVKAIIDGLLSEMNAQQNDARNQLSKKDDEIYRLTLEVKALDASKESEVRKALKMAEASAAKADQYKATLNEMDSFFGFGAIWYGIKKLFSRLMWILIIGGVLFLILRFASMSNPIAKAIFSIFEQVIAWFINMLKMLAPRATQFSNLIEKNVFDGYKKTLTHIIDGIQLLKEKDTDEADKYTLDDLMEQLSKDMDTADKNRVEGIKRELHWK